MGNRFSSLVLLASHTEDAPMMKIDCPFCGPRDELEFKCGGQSHVQRPDLSASDGEWAEYLYVRENPKGWHFERWLQDRKSTRLNSSHYCADSMPSSA